QQLAQASAYLAAALIQPYFFGLLWPAVLLAAIAVGRRLWTSPALFLLLFLGGNLLAILLAYAVAPTSSAEFPSYVRASLDRLLLHLTPSAALLLALGLKYLRGEPGIVDPRLSPQTPLPTPCKK